MQNSEISAGWKEVNSVLVVGAKGMLGSNVVAALRASGWATDGANRRIHPVDIEEIDITDPASVSKCIQQCRPAVLINCAGYTDVDGCETNSEQAFAVNAAGPMNLAEHCARANCKLVHISTDFVFNGRATKPYLPDDKPDPLSVYARSKLAGEQNVHDKLNDHLIVRTSWLFGIGGKNFVTTIANAARQRDHLEIVDDQVGSPTYTVDLAEALLAMIGAQATGTYHFRNEGQCSWYQFGCQIVKQYGIDIEVRPISSEQMSRPATRPKWSVLDITSYKQTTGRTVRPWPDALADFVQKT